MRVLVAYESKHGSTAGIAERVAQVLTDRGLAAECRTASDVDSLDGFDALVFGGAVYAGSWPKGAVAFVDRIADQTKDLPVWVFSSGPAGDPPRPEERPAKADSAAERLTPRDHAIFAGVIDRSGLSFVEKGIVGALRIADGDYRDWDAIEAWAGNIAGELAGV